MELLRYYKIEIDGKHCVILGRSNIVGKPMAHLMLEANATVTVCHSHTKNLADITKQADILVVAIGRANFVHADMVKPGAVVIDVGINRLADGSLAGDVATSEVEAVVSAITPVPGGVGPMTIAILMKNTLTAATKQVFGEK
jgi:methylenetetrahydrofolate dehydrogenase (NADP+)/methenyltetrahydrofolate cyclohydrolase